MQLLQEHGAARNVAPRAAADLVLDLILPMALDALIAEPMRARAIEREHLRRLRCSGRGCSGAPSARSDAQPCLVDSDILKASNALLDRSVHRGLQRPRELRQR
jgi:hypothetical protein